jgi:hypothetical protein
MTPREKAISLVDSYRNILINEDTECGNEILCTLIAMKCAIIAVDEIIHEVYDDLEWWKEVKHEIEKL